MGTLDFLDESLRRLIPLTPSPVFPHTYLHTAAVMHGIPCRVALPFSPSGHYTMLFHCTLLLSISSSWKTSVSPGVGGAGVISANKHTYSTAWNDKNS